MLQQPFINVGVDYFSPSLWRLGEETKIDGVAFFSHYLSIYESGAYWSGTQLDTDSCLNAKMRFSAQRGKPSTIISDNGTHFVGAEREFAEYVAAWKKKGIEEHLIQQGIRWKFNRPAAPHFGGLWERLVRSCKKQRMQCWGTYQSLIMDIFSTTMCIVEQTLNARPLTPVSSDVNNLEAMTPNHFLIGNKSICLPYLFCAENFADHRKLFRQTQDYANPIWDRCRKEYLPTLNNRQKWRSTANETLKEGNHLWLIDDSNKSWCYKLGRVTETIEGSDGVIRSARVRTNDGVYKRPVVKLAPLLPGKDVSIENRAADVAAELTNSITKLNSASRPIQALKLE